MGWCNFLVTMYQFHAGKSHSEVLWNSTFVSVVHIGVAISTLLERWMGITNLVMQHQMAGMVLYSPE